MSAGLGDQVVGAAHDVDVLNVGQPFHLARKLVQVEALHRLMRM
jgi:hypothetical protein